MSGYYLMHRGWQANPVFGSPRRDPFCRRSAWCWLVEHAAYEGTKARAGSRVISLERGQLSYSLRFLADAWGWGHERVRRFLSELKREAMVETAIETGQCLITVCNYEKYQDIAGAARQLPRRLARQTRDSSETNKKEGKEVKEALPSGERETARELAERMLVAWREECGDILGQPKKLSTSRITHCSARLKDLNGDIEAWREVCRRVRHSVFLTEKWQASIDWVLKAENFLKIQEGNYDDRATPLFDRRNGHAAETAAFEFVSRG